MTLLELAEWLSHHPSSTVGFEREKDGSWTCEVTLIRGTTAHVTKKNAKAAYASARAATLEAMAAKRLSPDRKLSS